MRRVKFNQKRLHLSCHQFTRTFCQRHSFIAHKRDQSRPDKMKKWKSDFIESPRYRGTDVDPVFQCRTSEEVWNVVIDRRKNSPSHIHRAIRKCATLEDIPMCWTLFDFAKSRYLVDANVYHHMIWILNHSDVYRDEEKLMLSYRNLITEMETLNIRPNFQFLTATFSLLTKYGQYNEAHRIWNRLKENQDDLLCSIHVWNSYIDLNIKQCLSIADDNTSHLTHTFKLMEEMQTDYRLLPNDATFNCIIAGISKLVKRRIKWTATSSDRNSNHRNDQIISEFVEIGEQMFKECCDKCGRDPYDNVYSAMIDLHGNIGNIEKAKEYLESVVRNQDSNVIREEQDERTLRSCFGSAIKAIINNTDISYEDGWKVIDHIIHDLMEQKCGLKPDVVSYGLLFHCCNAFGREHVDIKRIKKIYKEMLSKGIKPNSLALNNMAVAGLEVYIDDKKKADKFAKWIVRQFMKHQVPMPKTLQHKLNKLFVNHEDAITHTSHHKLDLF